jgi:uncharacterized MAPEG superfamily protein
MFPVGNITARLRTESDMTIALWCVLAAALLPIMTAGIAKAAGGSYNNGDPRGRAVTYAGLAKRAHAAHLNGFEAFPLFAVAVLVAEMKGGPRGMVDGLALLFIAARLAYVGCYLLDQATLRSTVWTIGLVSAIAVFVSPLWR